MAANHSLVKAFQNLKGLDLRSSDLLRESGASTALLNVDLRQTGALNKRKGFQNLALSGGGYGTVDFHNIELTTGVVTEELLSVDDDMHLMTNAPFTITYSGAGVGYYDVYLSETDSNVYFDVYSDNVRVLNQSLGTGSETSFVSVATLITAINALTDFTCTGTTATAAPAAFIPVQLNITISSSGTIVNFKYWVAVDTPVGYTTPFSAHLAAKDDSDFENASFAKANDILFISNGYDELHKYDGNRVYRAGMKAGAVPVLDVTGGTTLTGNFTYKYTYEYTDAKENVVEGSASVTATTGAITTKDVVVTIANIVEAEGFNTNQAIIDGNQTATNLLVDTGHSIKIGDFVYMTNTVDSEVVKRKVTALPDATHITIDTSTAVANNAIISCCKISLWRTKTGPSLAYYLVGELPNDSQNATFDYTDTALDAALGITFLEPVKPHALPPKGRYIDTWRGQLLINGKRDDVNNNFYSDIDSAEYFPSDNSFLTTGGGTTSGIRSLDNNLFIFKDSSIFSLTGDLGTDNFIVDEASREGIGCSASATIQELNGELWFLSQFGVYSISNKGIQERSKGIKPKFQVGHPFNFKKATSFNWIDNNKYILCMPSESTISSEVYANSSTEVYAYDTHWGAWLQWDGIEAVGGMAEVDDRIYFIGRTINSQIDGVDQLLKRIHADGLSSDYVDHTLPISFSYASHWETLGEPSIYKKFLRLKVHSLDASLNDFETDQFTIAVATEHNYEPNTVSSLSLDFGGGALGWGAGPWGSFPWGETRLPSLKSKLASRKAKSLRVIFTNATLKKNILISGYEFEVVAPFNMELKD